MTAEALLTPREIFKLYNISEKRLERLRLRGGGPPYHKIGKSVFYRVSTVEAWLNDRARQSTRA